MRQIDLETAKQEFEESFDYNNSISFKEENKLEEKYGKEFVQDVKANFQEVWFEELGEVIQYFDFEETFSEAIKDTLRMEKYNSRVLVNYQHQKEDNDS